MKLKRFASLVLAVVLATAFTASFASCGDKSDDVYVIGICQQIKHDALDAATEGFKKALIDKLGEDKVKFDYQDGAGDTNTITTIVNSFVSKKVDLIMANGTTALQNAANATLEIPILGTSITEYGVALSIDNFNGTVGGNISGTSDLAPLDEQAQMIIDLFPDAKTVGMLYCSSEPNSEYQVKVVTEYLTSKGITCSDYKFTDSNDVSLVAEKAAKDCDVIYVPTDNTVASCKETINSVVLPTETPIFAGEEGICGGCGVATLSISYYQLGYRTGEMAAQILTGEQDISKMPIQYDSNPVKKYNKEIADELGITIPEDYEEIK